VGWGQRVAVVGYHEDGPNLVTLAMNHLKESSVRTSDQSHVRRPRRRFAPAAGFLIAATMATTSGIVVGASAQGTPRATPAPFPTSAAIRPDEAWITYSWDGIEVSRPDGTDQHALQPAIAGDPGHPDWSPDGRRIVFVVTEQEADEALWIMGSDGSDAHEIVPPGCCGQDHPYWSPDGTSIAFTRWVGSGSSETSQIVVYDIADESLRVVAESTMPTELDQAHWSPDGTSCCAGGAIGLIPVATGELTILTDAVPFAGYPAWRPDGGSIAFDSNGLSYYESTTPEQATNLHLIDIDGSGLTQLTHNEPGARRATEPFWLSNDTIGYVAADAERSDNRWVSYVSADGRQLSDPTTPIRATHPQAHRPVPSPQP
jgi:Tol biopolymer transport system component